MTKEKAKQYALEARECLKNASFNTPTDEVGYDLYTFELDGETMNVFAYIRKEMDEDKKWYAIYAGVEYIDGENVYADYDNSTDHLRIDELTNAIYNLANMYTKPENLDNLRSMMGIIDEDSIVKNSTVVNLKWKRDGKTDLVDSTEFTINHAGISKLERHIRNDDECVMCFVHYKAGTNDKLGIYLSVWGDNKDVSLDADSMLSDKEKEILYQYALTKIKEEKEASL